MLKILQVIWMTFVSFAIGSSILGVIGYALQACK